MLGNDSSLSLHGSVVEDSILLRQDAMSVVNQTLTISKTGTVIFTGLGVRDTASYPRTVEYSVSRTF